MDCAPYTQAQELQRDLHKGLDSKQQLVMTYKAQKQELLNIFVENY